MKWANLWVTLVRVLNEFGAPWWQNGFRVDGDGDLGLRLGQGNWIRGGQH